MICVPLPFSHSVRLSDSLRLPFTKHGRKWDRFLLEPEQSRNSLAAREGLDERRPVLTPLWHQAEPYNISRPCGDGGRKRTTGVEPSKPKAR